ncbi:hypothetical protein GIB67_017025 [Kingdonia uniflora]|uniref:CMP/dCMP-type deaminase domain-containing protein n=1 Tax=Kingdonia uniflora TaxID=39325 RepID=A0A7J7LS23_9MAGN|nr:hypothetical protein GIB67_017025 [Kingdonia uniflora]
MAFLLSPTSTPFTSLFVCRLSNNSNSNSHSHSLDAQHIRRAAEISDKSAGFTSPHPNFGCVITKGSNVVGEGYLYAQGTKCAELQAVEAASELCKGATAYLNMESGDCHGDQTAVSALIKVSGFHTNPLKPGNVDGEDYSSLC